MPPFAGRDRVRHDAGVTRLRPFRRDDLPALLSLQHAIADTGAGGRWSAELLASQLTDPARDGGRRVVVAERGAARVGVAGWVEAGSVLFGAPLLAADRDAADRLVAHLVARARTAGAASVRISAGDGEAAKAGALAAAGFETVFQFLTLVAATTPVTAAVMAAAAPALVRRPLGSLGVAAYRELHNQAFVGVPSSLALDDDEARHLLDRHWPDASGVWVDATGTAAGFVVAVRDRDGDQPYVEDDSIAVCPSWQRHGLGAVMLAHMLTTAAGAGIGSARALVASSNRASLQLHQRMGFRERWRRAACELRL
jgi:GNAT superfamily N-acetyltransferase